jgi:hypothetical protein
VKQPSERFAKSQYEAIRASSDLWVENAFLIVVRGIAQYSGAIFENKSCLLDIPNYHAFVNAMQRGGDFGGIIARSCDVIHNAQHCARFKCVKDGVQHGCPIDRGPVLIGANVDVMVGKDKENTVETGRRQLYVLCLGIQPNDIRQSLIAVSQRDRIGKKSPMRRIVVCVDLPLRAYDSRQHFDVVAAAGEHLENRHSRPDIEKTHYLRGFAVEVTVAVSSRSVWICDSGVDRVGWGRRIAGCEQCKPGYQRGQGGHDGSRPGRVCDCRAICERVYHPVSVAWVCQYGTPVAAQRNSIIGVASR